MQSSHETLNVVEEKQQAEVGKDKDERVIPEEVNGKESSPGSGPGERRKVEPLTQKDSTSLSSESSSSSESEEEDVGEYRPHHRVTEGTIREEQEEDEEEVEEEPGRAAKVVEREAPVPAASAGPAGAGLSSVETVTQEHVVAPKIPAEKSLNEGAIEQAVSEEAEDQRHAVNGEVSHVDIDVLPQIICCSEVNESPKRELHARALSRVENTCLSPSVLPTLLQLFCKMLIFLSHGRKGEHCCVDVLPARFMDLDPVYAVGSPDRVNFPATTASGFSFSFHIQIFLCMFQMFSTVCL